ncbi:hypothetical protein ACN47E_004816 [Coniothyrium glycines]
MRFSISLTASLAVPFVAAHGHIPGMPTVFGLAHRDIAALKSRNILGGHFDRVVPPHGQQLEARQGGDAQNRCGPSFGCASCAEGYCCSPAGYCGISTDHCRAPDALFEYGPASDANKVPSGGSTRSTDRSAKGGQPLGGDGIRSCVVPGDVALTYDDGPYVYTDALLTLLARYSAKATFFITGINLSKGSIDETTAWRDVITRMDTENHQIASHTWSHQDLSAITSAQRYDQMIRNEMAITNILGKFPVYMRPPYSSCSATSGCQSDMGALGYVISSFDLDTDDYNHLTLEGIQVAKDNVYNAMKDSNPATSSFLSIAHDIHELTAVNLTSYMLEYIQSKGYNMVTLGTCLGVAAKADWYRTPASGSRTASTSSFSAPAVCTATSSVSGTVSATVSAASSTATLVSLDSTCGAASGYQCIGFTYQGNAAECCSGGGYCGNTIDHCGTSCQSGFGKCGTANVLVSSSSSSRSVSATSSSVSQSSSAASSSVSRSSSVVTSSSVRSTSASSSQVSSSTRISSSSAAASSSVRTSSASSSSSIRSSTAQFSSSSRLSSASSAVTRSSTASSSTLARSSSSSVSSRASSSVVSSSLPVASSSSVRVSSSAVSSSTRAASASSSSSVRVSSASSSAARTSSAAATPSSAAKVSTDGSCGGTKGYTCLGSSYGTCCSQYGWCGTSTAHCGAGCNTNSVFGTCTSSSVVSSVRSSAAAATSTAAVVKKASTDGSCGGTKGFTCTGSTFGTCCSQYGWCGSTLSYCRVSSGCQSGFGRCT